MAQAFVNRQIQILVSKSTDLMLLFDLNANK